MTIDYTGVDGGTFNNKIPGPSPGAQVTAASVGLVAQGAANQDKWIADHMVNGVDGGSYAGPLEFTDITHMVTSGDVEVNGQIAAINGGGIAIVVTGGVTISEDLSVAGDLGVTGSIASDVSVTAPLHLYASTQSLVRASDGTPHCSDHPNSIGGWINQRLEGVGPFDAWETTNAQPCVTQGMTLIVPIHLQHGQTLTGLRVYVKGADHTGVGALPANLMSATLYATTVGYSGAAAVIATKIDPSASIAAYKVDHSFDLVFGSPYVIDLVNETYALAVVSEWGAANVLAGAYYLGNKKFYDTLNVSNE